MSFHKPDRSLHPPTREILTNRIGHPEIVDRINKGQSDGWGEPNDFSLVRRPADDTDIIKRFVGQVPVHLTVVSRREQTTEEQASYEVREIPLIRS